MLNLIKNGVVIAGICVLTTALVPVRQLIAQLPAGPMRRRWYTLTGLIVLFIVSYLTYAIAFWKHAPDWLDFIVLNVFFSGAGFVWLTVSLSLQTVADVRRVTLLEQENITDPLTGIYNRRYLERRLEEECARSSRYALPLSVLMIDIDHFKHINDTYGHQVGDEVLKHFGKVILQAIRESDMAARYGGEEITILATNTPLASGSELAERLRQHVEGHELVLTSDPNNKCAIRLTVSVGVADLSPDAADGQSLIRNADKALYRAKQEGRNRVITYEV